jgi:3-oxoacyl-[acyl-carrier protein] reductase
MTQANDRKEGGVVRRVALVFGGSRSVDAATVARLVDSGFIVAHVCTARPNLTQETSSRMSAPADAVVPIELDNTRAGWVPDAIARTVAQVGLPDAVVINAGLLQFPTGASLALGDLELRLGSDVRRIYEIVQCAAPHMRDGGRIVTVAAGAAEWNGATAAVMSMARAAVASLVKGLALDLSGRRIAVNNIQSGPIDADMANDYAPHLDGRIPLGWVGKPQEIAALVVYLASDASGAMTGASITIDGGFAL